MNLHRREEIRFYANGLESSDGLCAAECKDAILELLAHIDALEQTAAERVIADGKTRAVVVPELPKFNPAWELSYRGKVASEKEQQAFANGYQFAMHKAEEVLKNARVIPADRVLGYAEIPVKEGVWQRAYLLIRRSRKLATEGGSSGCWRMHNEDADKFLSEFTAYSANQGGAAT